MEKRRSKERGKEGQRGDQENNWLGGNKGCSARHVLSRVGISVGIRFPCGDDIERRDRVIEVGDAGISCRQSRKKRNIRRCT